jgi:hypothetical protein
MAFLSQYAGATDIYRLKLKNGPYLDEVVPSSSNHHIRDFTAQNDHLMISMTNGKVYVAERNNELLECLPNNADLFNTSSYDLLIGGDPFVSDTNKLTSAIAYYQNATTDSIRNSSYGPTHRTIYYAPIGASVTSGSNSATTTLTNSIRRFMYVGGNLFYFIWNASSDTLRVLEVDHTTGAWTNVDITASSTSAPVNTATEINFTGITSCTYPEIVPASGNILMFFTTATNQFKLEYDLSSGQWDCVDVAGLNMSTSEPSSLAIGTDRMMIANSVTSSSTYLTSNISGSVWSTITVSNEWNVKQCGFANNRFYTITNEGSGSIGTPYSGVLMSAQFPANNTTWVYESTPEVPAVKYIRNNGLGTACYISTGYHLGGVNNNQSFHAIKKIT